MQNNILRAITSSHVNEHSENHLLFSYKLLGHPHFSSPSSVQFSARQHSNTHTLYLSLLSFCLANPSPVTAPNQVQFHITVPQLLDFIQRAIPVTHGALAAAPTDDELRTLLVSTTALQLLKFLIPGTSVELYSDTYSGKPRPYVPSPLRRQIFDSLHSVSHPDIKATVKLVSQRFVWPAIRKACRTWARAFQPCQRSNVSRHTITPLGNLTLPPARFLHVHIDIVVPLPSSAGFQY